MTWFHDLKIASKLFVAFLCLLVLTVFIGVFSLTQLYEVRETTRVIATNWMPNIGLVSDIDTNFSAFRLAQHEYILGKTPEQLADAEGGLAQALQRLRTAMTRYEERISSERERKVYDELRALWEGHFRDNPRLIQLSRQNKDEEATALMLSSMRAWVEGRGQWPRLRGSASPRLRLPLPHAPG